MDWYSGSSGNMTEKKQIKILEAKLEALLKHLKLEVIAEVDFEDKTDVFVDAIVIKKRKRLW